MARNNPVPDRRTVIADMQRQTKNRQRLRDWAIVGACSLIALAILVVGAWKFIGDKIPNPYDGKELAAIGASAADAGCSGVRTLKADGNQQHVAYPTPVTYTTAPPAFGPHWNQQGVAPVDMARKFYTTKDRPALEALVHNLEHGYTILWYDATLKGDELDQIKAIANKFNGTTDFRDKFIAVPWTDADAKSILKKNKPQTVWPAGKHIALTHWSAGGNGNTDTSKQVGVFDYCTSVSGAVVKSFMQAYPYTDSPEPPAM